MRIFCHIIALGILLSCNKTHQQTSSTELPNIIFIFIDDMGYGDLSSYGNAGVKTPNIDRLAGEGIRFTQFYVNSPVCSPSRVAVTTGQYPLRWNITSYLADSTRNSNRGMDQYLNPAAPSLARILQEAGYYTAHVGKWHMGGQRNVEGAPLISEFGFNSSLTSFEGLGERLGLTFETREWNGSNRFPLSVQQARLGHGEVRWVKRHKSPELFVDRTLEEIQKARRQEQPFYINLWTDAVHTPLEAPPALRGNESIRAQYYGVIRNLDSQLGRVFDHIRSDAELRDNTIVVLTSDNGPSHRIGSSAGLRAHKGSLYEGGIREPFVVWSPGKIKDSNTGRVNHHTLLTGMDIPPSLLSLAGIEAPDSVQFDGLDMSEAFIGESAPERGQPVMWVCPPDFRGPDNKWQALAIREGKWKLLVNTDTTGAELYNLKENPGETINVVEDYPEVASGLQAEVLGWFDAIISNTTGSAEPWE